MSLSSCSFLRGSKFFLNSSILNVAFLSSISSVVNDFLFYLLSKDFFSFLIESKVWGWFFLGLFFIRSSNFLRFYSIFDAFAFFAKSAFSYSIFAKSAFYYSIFSYFFWLRSSLFLANISFLSCICFLLIMVSFYNSSLLSFKSVALDSSSSAFSLFCMAIFLSSIIFAFYSSIDYLGTFFSPYSSSSCFLLCLDSSLLANLD